MTVTSVFTRNYGYTNAWLDKATKHGRWTQADQEWFDFSKRINPYVGLYEDRYKRERYFNRYGMDYSDVVQPWNLPGGSDASLAGVVVGRAMNYVSHNVGELYDEDEDKDPELEWMKKQYRADFRR